MKKLRILVLMHESLVPPESIEGLTDKEINPFKTEYDVVVTLKEMGHEVKPLGVASDLGLLRRSILAHLVLSCIDLAPAPRLGTPNRGRATTPRGQHQQ